MSIPVATTTISILASSQDGTKDRRDPPTYTVESTGIRAVIGSPGGSELVSAGTSEQKTFRLNADPCDLDHTKRVRDDTTGETYEVVWFAQRDGFGLTHTVADIRQSTDRVSV
jgi:hypothetical protein